MEFLKNIKCDLTPLVKSLAGIIDSGHAGVSKLIGLAFGHKYAELLRDQILREEQNRADAAAIAGGKRRYDNGELMDVLDEVRVSSAVGLIGNVMLKDEVQNLLQAIERSAKLLEEISPQMVSQEPVQKTFFNRWREEVKLIDDDQLRTLWAKIMAQEVIQPGTISLRTLDVVRNLSANEARLFQQMLKGEIVGIIPVNGDGHPQFINYSEALVLQNAGLIFSQQSRRKFDQTYDVGQGRRGIAIPLTQYHLVACVEKTEYSVQCYILTDAAKCLLPIAQERRDLSVLEQVFMHLAKQTGSPRISLHAMIPNADNQLRWNSIPLWTASSNTEAKEA